MQRKGIKTRILTDIAGFFQVDVQTLSEKDDLILDHRVDSLDILRLIVFLEKKYSIRYDMMRYRNFTSISLIVDETLKLLGNNG